MTLRELMEKRAKALADAREIHNAAEKESRDLTAEEQQRYDKFLDDHAKLGQRIDREKKLADEEARSRESANPEAGGGAIPPQRGDGGGEASRVDLTGVPEGLHAFVRSSSFAVAEYRAGFGQYLVRGGLTPAAQAIHEQRSLQADSDILGGYITVPPQTVAQLIQGVDNLVFLRGLASKFAVPSAASLGVPTLDADPADADWTSELKTGDEDTAMAFGKRELHPHPLAKRIKVSNRLLRAAAIGPEALVRDRLAYKFAVTEEKAFLTGSGSQQPLGVFTASDQGIPTSRDVSTGNTTTSMTVDGIKEAKYTLKGNYWGRAQWLFHRDGVKQLAKLKDGDGRYLWQDSISASEPDRLVSLPVNMSEYAPNTFTTGLYVGILGDFSNYWIADALNMQLQRLNELYAETNQTGFIGRMELDGMPVLAEAFVRVKLA